MELDRKYELTLILFELYLAETEQDLSAFDTAPQAVVEDFEWWVECNLREIEYRSRQSQQGQVAL